VERVATTVPPSGTNPTATRAATFRRWRTLERVIVTTSPACFTTPRLSTQRLDEIDPWVERVHRKIERNIHDIVMAEEDGTGSARTVVVAYGGTARSARHAVKLARQRRCKAGLVTLLTIWPFAEDVIARIARTAKRIIVPEMNLGQLALEVERIAGDTKSCASIAPTGTW